MGTGRRGLLLGSTLILAVLFGGVGFAAARLGSESAATEEKADAIESAYVLAEVVEHVPSISEAFEGSVLDIGSVPLDQLNPGVITALAEDGSEIREGQVVVEINNRPVIVLQGPYPQYRSFVRGVSGEDVTVLQEALVRLGYELSVDGVYGGKTAAAVAALYKSVGQAPPEPDPELLAEIETIRKMIASTPAIPEDQTGADSTEIQALQRQLGELRWRAVTPVPLGEILVVGELPIRFKAGSAEVGDQSQDVSLEIESTNRVVKIAVEARSLPVSEGQLLPIRLGGETFEGIIGAIHVVQGSGWILDISGLDSADVGVGDVVSLGAHSGPAEAFSAAIPVGALYFNAQGREVVTAMVDGSAVEIAVTVGRVNAGMVEITEGLELGMKVVVGIQLSEGT